MDSAPLRRACAIAACMRTSPYPLPRWSCATAIRRSKDSPSEAKISRRTDTVGELQIQQFQRLPIGDPGRSLSFRRAEETHWRGSGELASRCARTHGGTHQAYFQTSKCSFRVCDSDALLRVLA